MTLSLRGFTSLYTLTRNIEETQSYILCRVFIFVCVGC
jgi:hypothetical protein